MFFRGSRYEQVADAVYTTSGGREIPYKRLRIIPDTITLQEYVVRQRDRLDLIAFNFHNDPEQFWRICDAKIFPDQTKTRFFAAKIFPAN